MSIIEVKIGGRVVTIDDSVREFEWAKDGTLSNTRRPQKTIDFVLRTRAECELKLLLKKEARALECSKAKSDEELLKILEKHNCEDAWH